MSNFIKDIRKQISSYGKINLLEIENNIDIFEAGYLDSIESLEFSIYLCSKYENLNHNDLSNLEIISINNIINLINENR